jgi:hypothetical protein
MRSIGVRAYFRHKLSIVSSDPADFLSESAMACDHFPVNPTSGGSGSVCHAAQARFPIDIGQEVGSELDGAEKLNLLNTVRRPQLVH